MHLDEHKISIIKRYIYMCDYTTHSHVWQLTSTYLRDSDICSLMCVDRNLRDIFSSDEYYLKRIHETSLCIIKTTATIRFIIGLIVDDKKYYMNDGEKKENLDRLKFLDDTVKKIGSYFGNYYDGLQESLGSHGKYNIQYIVLSSINNQLYELYYCLRNIYSGNRFITVNFDIFEIALKKTIYDFEILFPKKFVGMINYSDLIEDPDAKSIWVAKFGENCPAININTFINEFLNHNGIQNKAFIGYFTHLFNFPKLGIMPISRFNTIIKLFGPYKNFIENFEKIVVGTHSGFVGYMNSVGCEQFMRSLMKEGHIGERSYIVRFSRTQPNVFTITFIEKNNIRHIRLSHEKYIKIFAPYTLIRVGLRHDSISINNLDEYTSRNSDGIQHCYH